MKITIPMESTSAASGFQVSVPYGQMSASEIKKEIKDMGYKPKSIAIGKPGKDGAEYDEVMVTTVFSKQAEAEEYLEDYDSGLTTQEIKKAIVKV